MAKVLNRDRLRKKLRELPDAIRKEIQEPMEKGAQDIVDLAIHLVPHNTGALANSIDWVYGEPPRGALGATASKRSPARKDDLVISVFAGNERAYYARFVEFGTAPGKKGDITGGGHKGRRRIVQRTHGGTKPQPFFYPAYRAHKNKVASRVKNAVNKAIKKMGGVNAVVQEK